jgi:hypothetical protein
MRAAIKRLASLALTLDRLRDRLAGEIVALQQERAGLVQRRAGLETLMSSDQRFLDLTLGGGLKRLRDMAARISVIDRQVEALQKRSADAYLKAKRVRDMARLRLALRAKEQDRKDLIELGDRHAAASLRQATET